MKKLIVALLALVLAVTPLSALADEDWSNFSDDDIRAVIADLSNYIAEAQAELDRRQGVETPAEAPAAAQAVKVPAGVWNVPEDIPAGHYTIQVDPEGDASWGAITVGTALDGSGKAIDYRKSEYYFSEMIKQPGADAPVPLDVVDYDFKNGDILIIEFANMIFTPFEKPKLGF